MEALANFIDRKLDLAAERTLRSPFDPDWRSPSELHQDHDWTYWRPVRQEEPVSFAGLENALEFEIHPDIKAYYGSFWSGTLEADSTEGPVSLIQLWNPEDFDRLVANLVGHALNKRRTGTGYSVFFANTDPDSELFLSIDNESGAILLEEPDKKPLRQVDDSVQAFLDRLSPAEREPDLY